MNSCSKRKVLYSVMLAALFSTLFAPLAESQESKDISAENYKVTFAPWGEQKIMIRDESGNFLGYSIPGAAVEMRVSRDVIQRSTTPAGVDVKTLLSQLSPMKDSSGNLYYMMAVPATTTNAAGETVPYQMVTAEGVVIPAGKRVLLDLRDFYQEKVLQPTGAGEGVNSQPQTIDNFNNTQAQVGVTEPTRPPVAAPSNNDEDSQIAVPQTTDDEDDVPDSPLAEYSPANKDGIQTYGSPFPMKIFSSPVCSCKGSCRITSQVGHRTSRRTKNGRHMSKNHQGMDIGAGYGTRVNAAADGCLKIVSKSPACIARTGRTLPISCIREGGYGYTVRLVHGNGYETQYSHLSAISPAIRAGACFKRGDRIGSVGESGNSTGPHLHFGVYRDRRMVDPRINLMSTSGQFLNPSCNALPEYRELDISMARGLGMKAPGIQARLAERAAARARSAQ